jgi:streptogramin lyase
MQIQRMAADRKGNVYILGSGAIWRFEGATGKELGHLDCPGPGAFNDITVTPDGGLVASQTGISDSIIRFDEAGRTTLVIQKPVSTQSKTAASELRVAVDAAGDLYALSSFSDFSNAVYKFSVDGKYITRFGREGDLVGEFRHPLAIAVDGHGRVYVSDSGTGIQVFDGNGRYLDWIIGSGRSLGMVFNDKGELLVARGTFVTKLAINKQ